MKSPEPGCLVFIRYRDHVLFKDANAEQIRPWNRECVGWLDFADAEHVRIVWERFAMPNPPLEDREMGSGLVILRSAIMEMVDVRRLLRRRRAFNTPVYRCKSVYTSSRHHENEKVETPQC